MDLPKAGIMDQLQWSLQALAQPGEVQLGLYPDFVCKADELALDLDHWWTCARGNFPEKFTPSQCTCVNALHQFLGEMSGQHHHELWTDEALRSHPRWDEVRSLARRSIEALKWPLEAPPAERAGTSYIPAGD